MSTPLPLPRGLYNDQKNDLLHGIWNQLSLINGQPASALDKRSARGGFGNSTEDLLYQITQELATLALPLKNRLGGVINVKDYGALGDGLTDDTAAIQAAIDVAKNRSVAYQRATVFFPSGFYKVTKELNCTGANGLWLVGEGGRYLNSVIVGYTPSCIADFVSSTLSGAAFLGFRSSNGQTLNGAPAMSSIGVQFGLGTNAKGELGGNNCSLLSVCIELANLTPAVNGGLGSIPVLNVRSEEFSAHDIYVHGNTAMVFSNSINLLPYAGYNFTASSKYATWSSDGNGSMGVINLTGQLRQYEKYSPGLLLNGANSVNFNGYMSRTYTTPSRTDTYDTAIKTSQVTYGVRITGTIEVFSTLLDQQNGLENADIMVNLANQDTPSKPIVDLGLSGGFDGVRLAVALPNPGERVGRELIRATPVGAGDQPTNAFIHNSQIICSTFGDNRLSISPNVLRNVVNSTFATGQAYEVVGNAVKQRFSAPVQAGVLGNVSAASVIRFSAADRNTRSSMNAGSYVVRTSGRISCGTADSGAYAVLDFESTITYVQNLNRSARQVTQNVAVTSSITTNSGAMSLAAPTVSLDMADANLYRVLITPSVSGANVGEPIWIESQTEVISNFPVNRSVLFF